MVPFYSGVDTMRILKLLSDLMRFNVFAFFTILLIALAVDNA